MHQTKPIVIIENVMASATINQVHRAVNTLHSTLEETKLMMYD